MKYYCIGIKGSGMSTLAQILYDLGNEVSGYDDVVDYKFTQEGLDRRGIKIYHEAHPIDSDTIVTYSAAFSLDHPEIKRVMELGLTIQSYHDLLGDLSRKFETICVSGTHGKTTTSTLISHVLTNTLGCNYFIGDGSGYATLDNKYFVLESCEFQKHFLAYTPTYTIITNIELEHTECYDGIEDIRNTFSKFSSFTKNSIIACGDDKNIRMLSFTKPVLYYGFREDNDVVAKDVVYSHEGISFTVYFKDEEFGRFDLPLFGRHMLLDALAAITMCHELSISYDTMHELLKTFENAKRRFKETVVGNNVVIDDYAHHPTEIQVTLQAARQKYPDKELVVVFKPNTYSRTDALKDGFIEALKTADKAYMTEIDCNRERSEDYPDVNSQMILDKVPNSEIIGMDTMDKLLDFKNAVICFMSCADVSHMIDKYYELVK